ncbi:unnamed protein product [Zymoseptoria tritici ST99CH_1E4]|uniref:Uncharacterized protein n=1 Tax=Zymoseptoria tritici ST99CH_1E4 TaxID=1276532 RepID=A0A2H1G432_ZYMTR|nr:unnamed protein product [Zymoseptoria tritici ST99CH_1E4]
MYSSMEARALLSAQAELIATAVTLIPCRLLLARPVNMISLEHIATLACQYLVAAFMVILVFKAMAATTGRDLGLDVVGLNSIIISLGLAFNRHFGTPICTQVAWFGSKRTESELLTDVLATVAVLTLASFAASINLGSIFKTSPIPAPAILPVPGPAPAPDRFSLDSFSLVVKNTLSNVGIQAQQLMQSQLSVQTPKSAQIPPSTPAHRVARTQQSAQVQEFEKVRTDMVVSSTWRFKGWTRSMRR